MSLSSRPHLNQAIAGSLVVAALWSTRLEADPVHLADPNLESAVRAEIGKPTGDLTSEDLASLRRLVAPNAGITSCAGMAAAMNLEVLDLSGNFGLNSLVLPDEMPHLVELRLGHAGLNHLSLPARAPALVTLDLGGNPLNHLVLPEDLPAGTHDVGRRSDLSVGGRNPGG